MRTNKEADKEVVSLLIASLVASHQATQHRRAPLSEGIRFVDRSSASASASPSLTSIQASTPASSSSSSSPYRCKPSTKSKKKATKKNNYLFFFYPRPRGSSSSLPTIVEEDEPDVLFSSSLESPLSHLSYFSTPRVQKPLLRNPLAAAPLSTSRDEIAFVISLRGYLCPSSVSSLEGSSSTRRSSTNYSQVETSAVAQS